MIKKIKSGLQYLKLRFVALKELITGVSEKIEEREEPLFKEILLASNGKKLSLRVIARVFGFQYPRSRLAINHAIKEVKRLGFYVQKTNNPSLVRLVA